MYVNRHVNRRASFGSARPASKTPLEHRNDVKRDSWAAGVAVDWNTVNNPTQTPARIVCMGLCGVFSGQPTQP